MTHYILGLVRSTLDDSKTEFLFPNNSVTFKHIKQSINYKPNVKYADE